MKTLFKSSREAAVSVLSDILESGAYANIALRKTLTEVKLDSRDRAFVTELVNETLRNLLSIDYVLNHFSKVPVAKMKPFIRNLLRMSVCQLRHMEKTPDSAAVNEAVILAKANGYAGLSGFVNGVLRTVARQPGVPAMPGKDNPEYLARRYSYPGWLATSLVKWLGAKEAELFCHNSHLPPPVTIFVNTHKTTPSELAKRLHEEGVEITPIISPIQADIDNCPLKDFLTIRSMGDISRLASFREGHFIVMDPGAIFAVAAMVPRPGHTVIDLCAAPGGKAFATACYMGNTGRVHAFDVHPHRTSLISDMLRQLGLTCVAPETKDATTHDPGLDASADAVLLDAPCSGFGTVRKRPEIKYNRNPSDIAALAEKQRSMMSVGAKYVKPGGVFVYSTCTITREENIDNVHWFLRQHPFKMRPIQFPQSNEVRFIEEDDCIQILPGPINDGFFVAVMVKDS